MAKSKAKTGELWHVSPAELIPTKDNARRVRNDASMKEFIESVSAHGVLQPLSARPHPKKEGMFEVRAGARRLHAAKVLELETVPVMVFNWTDEEAREVTALENLQREDLSPLEQSEAIDLILRTAGNVADAAARMGKSEDWVRRRASITTLTDNWKKALKSDDRFLGFGVGHLELIVVLLPEDQDAILEELMRCRKHEAVSVYDIRRMVSEQTMRVGLASWDVSDETLVPSAGACDVCEKRSGCRQFLPGLMDGWRSEKITTDDRCLSVECWKEKKLAHIDRVVAAAKEKHKNLLVVNHEGHPLGSELRDKYKTVAYWNVNGAKKSDKGARPAINIGAGKTSGKIYWASLAHGTTRSSLADNKQKGQTSLAVRKAKKNRQRECLALSNLAKALEEVHWRDAVKAEKVLVLVSVFGTNDNAAHERSGGQWKEAQKICEAPPPSNGMHASGPALEACDRIWSNLVPVFLERIRVRGSGDKPNVAEAKQICELLGLNWSEFMAAATAELPDPKSWKNLNADGTKKVKKKAAKKPKAKKKSKSSGKKKASKKDAVPA